MDVAGRLLGHYRMIERVGAGGMGVVYRARDERLQRDVAIKVLPPGLLADEDARRRFRREALALAKLNHPHIATVYDFDRHEDIDFLVMELVPGEMLADRIRHGRLPEREVLRIAREIAAGLAAAHARGVLHRDLKPANVRITPDGEVKILDFGLARLLATDAATGVVATATETMSSEAGVVLGTLPYAPPEILRGDRADARSDIYSFGVMLYEMTTGRRPFAGTTASALVYQIAQGDFDAPRILRGDLSPALEGIILRCLDSAPARRYQTARELGTALETLSVEGPPARGRGRRAKSKPLRPWWWIGAGAGLGIAVIALSLGLNIGGLRDRLLRPAATGPPSLAVLPLVNSSGDPAQEYFVDGMTGEIINALAGVSALRVTARSSVMGFKGTRTPIAEAAKRLGVTYILEGSIARSGGRIRLTAELVRAAIGEVIWAGSFERPEQDVLTLQADLGRTVAREVRVNLTPEEGERFAGSRSVRPDVYEAYLRGKHSILGRDRDNIEAAEARFQEAIGIDSTYAPAWVGLAEVEFALSNRYVPPDRAMPRALAFAERALAIDPGLPDANVIRGVVLAQYHWRWDDALEAIDRALSVNPNLAEGYSFRGYILMELGRFEESLGAYAKALVLNPLSTDLSGYRGWALYFAGRYDESIEVTKKLIDLDPGYADPYTWVGLCYLRKGLAPEAIRYLELAAARADHPWPKGQLAYGYAVTGRPVEARRLLDELNAMASKGAHVPAMTIATVYAGLGERDAMFESLERAVMQRDEDALWLKIDPAFAPYRADSRFSVLTKRLNLS